MLFRFVSVEVHAAGGVYLPERLAFLNGAKLSGLVGYQGERFHFFGTPDPSLERFVNSFSVGGGLISSPKESISYRGSAEFRRLTLRDIDESREDNLTLAFQASREFRGFQIRGEVFYAGDFLHQSIANKDPHYLRTTAGLRKQLFEKLDVSAALGLYLYRNSDTGFRSKLYPNLALQYYLNQQWTVFAQFEPKVEQNSLSLALSQNRYIGNDVAINHQDLFMDLSAGAQFELPKQGSGRVYLKYQRVRDFPVYLDPSTFTGAISWPYGDWDISYQGTTRFLSFNAEILLDLTKADRLNGKMTILSSENSGKEKEVPYVAPIEITSSYSHQFPSGLSTQISGRFVGRRSIDHWNNFPELNSFFLLGASAEYRVGKNFSLFLQLNNIFDEHYSIWNRYQEVPLSVLGGITAKW